MNLQRRENILFALIYFILTSTIITTQSFLSNHGFDVSFLKWSSLLLWIITTFAFLLQVRGLRTSNPNVFVRSVYLSMIFKMFICMIAVLIYVFLFRNKINKPGLFTAMGMYIIYTVAEVSALMKIARKKTNA